MFNTHFYRSRANKVSVGTANDPKTSRVPEDDATEPVKSVRKEHGSVRPAAAIAKENETYREEIERAEKQNEHRRKQLESNISEMLPELADDLRNHILQGRTGVDWFQAVGIGAGCLYVYCVLEPPISIPYELRKVPVHVRVIGKTVVGGAE